MAKVVLLGLEMAAARQIEQALQDENHRVVNKSLEDSDTEILDADIVFASGEGKQYLALLKRVRAASPALPFVVVTRLPETAHWLDALEAGATDYCSAPFEPHQLRWLRESALVRTCPAAAA
jgi:DNA-binding response OmpR family regulator